MIRRRPTTELGFVLASAMILAAASVTLVPGVEGSCGAALAVAMILIAAIDARYFVIPDPLNLAGLVLGFVNVALTAESTVLTALGVALARGVAFALALFALRVGYRIIRGHDGLGLGDVKLAGVAGIWLDWPMMPVAIEIAAFAALTAYLGLYIVRSGLIGKTTRLPFGLFFAPSIWLVWLIEARLLS